MTSFGSMYSGRSGALTPLRVSVYLNGAGAGGVGRRVVLDRSDSFSENIQRIAQKLGLAGKALLPKLYTKQGILLDDIDEVIEGEVLYFDPRGLPFSSSGEKSIDEMNVSFGSAASVDGMSVTSTSSRRRRKPRRTSATTQGTANNSMGSGIPPAPSYHTVEKRTARANSFEYDYLFKFILVGRTEVGKTCILLRFTDQRFRKSHQVTIGVDFGCETIAIRNKNIKIQVWDTAGQETFRAITRAYFREAAAAILVYDVTNRQSFEDLKQWLDTVRSTSTNRALTITLIGNKVDKMTPERQVTSREGELFARDNGLLFMETSALTGENVREAFARTADAVLRKIDQGLISLDDPNQGVRRGEFSVDVSSLGKGSTVTSQNSQLNIRGTRPSMDEEYGCYC